MTTTAYTVFQCPFGSELVSLAFLTEVPTLDAAWGRVRAEIKQNSDECSNGECPPLASYSRCANIDEVLRLGRAHAILKQPGAQNMSRTTLVAITSDVAYHVFNGDEAAFHEWAGNREARHEYVGGACEA